MPVKRRAATRPKASAKQAAKPKKARKAKPKALQWGAPTATLRQAPLPVPESPLPACTPPSAAHAMARLAAPTGPRRARAQRDACFQTATSSKRSSTSFR